MQISSKVLDSESLFGPIQVFRKVDRIDAMRPLAFNFKASTNGVCVANHHSLTLDLALTVPRAEVKPAEGFIGMTAHRNAKTFGDECEQLVNVVAAGDAAGRQIGFERKHKDRFHKLNEQASLDFCRFRYVVINKDEAIIRDPACISEPGEVPANRKTVNAIRGEDQLGLRDAGISHELAAVGIQNELEHYA